MRERLAIGKAAGVVDRDPFEQERLLRPIEPYGFEAHFGLQDLARLVGQSAPQHALKPGYQQDEPNRHGDQKQPGNGHDELECGFQEGGPYPCARCQSKVCEMRFARSDVARYPFDSLAGLIVRAGFEVDRGVGQRTPLK